MENMTSVSYRIPIRYFHYVVTFITQYTMCQIYVYQYLFMHTIAVFTTRQHTYYYQALLLCYEMSKVLCQKP